MAFWPAENPHFLLVQRAGSGFRSRIPKLGTWLTWLGFLDGFVAQEPESGDLVKIWDPIVALKLDILHGFLNGRDHSMGYKTPKIAYQVRDNIIFWYML